MFHNGLTRVFFALFLAGELGQAKQCIRRRLESEATYRQSLPGADLSNTTRRLASGASRRFLPGADLRNAAYGYVDHEADDHICHGAAGKVQEKFEDSVDLLLRAGHSNKETLLEMAGDVFEWCSSEEAGLSTLLTRQCKGYSALLREMIKLDLLDGASNFFVASRGSASEQDQGCAFVVNTVNAAVRNGLFEGLSVAEVSEGVFITPWGNQETVLVADSKYRMVELLGEDDLALTVSDAAPSETNFLLKAASGGAAMMAFGVLRYLCEWCDDYEAFELAADF